MLSDTLQAESRVLYNGNYSAFLCFWGLVVCNSESVTVALLSVFWISTKKWLQHCLVVIWLVPHESAAISVQVLCIPYNHAPVYSTIFFAVIYEGCMCV